MPFYSPLASRNTLAVTSTTDATSTTSAPLKSAGGLAVAKKSFFGDAGHWPTGDFFQIGPTGSTNVARGVKRFHINVVTLTDAAATTVATITTQDETGSNDGGVWGILLRGIVLHQGDANLKPHAVKVIQAAACRAIDSDALTGANSAVTEAIETASAATDASTRDIGTVTVTLAETSEYVVTVQINADATGTDVGPLRFMGHIELWWFGFLTPPDIT